MIEETNLQSLNCKIILCDVINPLTDNKAELIRKGAIVIKNGKILEIGKAKDILPRYARLCPLELICAENKLALPTFFDMHFHWVQDDVRLMSKESLLEWLSKYTWPYEAKFKNKTFTKKKAKYFTQELLRVGTLGGVCYSSLHSHTTDEALKNFVGNFVVGNVLMDMNSPKYLTHKKEVALKMLQKQTAKFKNRYAVTPRFAITATPELMKAGAKLAKTHQTFIQTHLSETLNEIDYVLSIYKKIDGFKDVKTYTDIYKRCGLLGPKTIMGHGIYLSPDEMKILSKTKTTIAHCPTSNAPVKELGIGSGLFDFHQIEKNKIRWALGSDIGGGPYLSMFDVMRSFVEQNTKKKVKGATYVKALYRATLAGAEILKLNKSTGNLAPGKEANFIFVSSPKKQTGEKAESVLQKIIKPLSKKRTKYHDLVDQTWNKGEIVYSKY